MLFRKKKARVAEPMSEMGPPEITVSINGLGQSDELRIAMKKSVWRAIIEVGFIVFLFYSNLLMGEFERSGLGQKKGLAWAIADVFTSANFEIAALTPFVGYVVALRWLPRPELDDAHPGWNRVPQFSRREDGVLRQRPRTSMAPIPAPRAALELPAF